jgi:cell division transport system permease protein
MGAGRPGRRAPALLRPARFDDLGLRRALSDRLLPSLVAAMAFLAALALAGTAAASALGRHWQEGAGSVLTVQVPQPAAPAADGAGGRLDRVLALLHGTPGIASARALGEGELEALLRPWLGSGSGRIALPLPAVIDVRLSDAALDAGRLAALAATAAPGTLLEGHDRWMRRLAVLARSLQACAGLALAVVAFVAAAVVAVAVRAGLATRRDAIEIVHGLGATDGYIAGRFARRATLLAAAGAGVGAAAAVPVLLGLAGLAAPFTGQPEEIGSAELAHALPPALWLSLPALPAAAAAIGWLTAQGTVRRWLRRLP